MALPIVTLALALTVVFLALFGFAFSSLRRRDHRPAALALLGSPVFPDPVAPLRGYDCRAAGAHLIIHRLDSFAGW